MKTVNPQITQDLPKDYSDAPDNHFGKAPMTVAASESAGICVDRGLNRGFEVYFEKALLMLMGRTDNLTEMLILLGAISFLPTLFFYLVGEEGIFGTVESVACLLSAIVMYVVGRKVNLDRSWKMVAIGSLVVFAGTLTLSFWYGVVGVLANLVLMTIGRSLIWTSSYSQTMELMDQGKGAEMPERQYAYVFDNELFFNVGRVMGVGILLYMIYVGGINFALRYIFLLAAALHVRGDRVGRAEERERRERHFDHHVEREIFVGHLAVDEHRGGLRFSDAHACGCRLASSYCLCVPCFFCHDE